MALFYDEVWYVRVTVNELEKIAPVLRLKVILDPAFNLNFVLVEPFKPRAREFGTPVLIDRSFNFYSSSSAP